MSKQDKFLRGGFALFSAITSFIFVFYAVGVITGAGVGLVAGWLMPWLMHYRHDLSKREQGKMRHLYYLAPYGDAGSIGLSAAGAF